MAQKTIAYSGQVKDVNQTPIEAVNILNQLGELLSSTDSNGKFKFESTTLYEVLYFTNENYVSDTLRKFKTNNIQVRLKPLRVMSGVKVIGEGKRNSEIKGFTMKTEAINEGELKKAACCDLAGCFGTQGTVQPMTTNVLTNSKELRILGVSGVYNQVLFDNMPAFVGLPSTYGISSVPGTLVRTIFVSKGANSVLQGFESMVGQVNVIPKEFNYKEKLLVNQYVNSFGENQHNVNFGFKHKNIRNVSAVHLALPGTKWDRDKDGFLDLPLLTRYSLFNKLQFRDISDKGLSFDVGVKLLDEKRNGGQSDFVPSLDEGSQSVYGQKVAFNQIDVYSRVNYNFSDASKLTMMTSVIQHNQNSWFGTVNYKGIQKQLYYNLQYDRVWNRNHDFKAGVSYRRLNIEEKIGFSDTFLKRTYNGNYLKNEMIPGVFAENVFKWRAEIISLILGVRADHHNVFGWQVTPRASLKYDYTENAVFRMSVGKGWRTVNLFSENIGLLVSSRDIVFKEFLQPEKAVNWGLNFLQKFKKKHFEGYFTFDFYQTRFGNQFFPDYDSEPGKAIVANFSGTSVSNGFQVDLNTKIAKFWELKMAYNFLDVYRRTQANEKYILPFNSKHKFLAALSYATKNKKWRMDGNLHWNGKQRLPNTELYPEAFKLPEYSRSYTTLSLQLTKTWKKFELYGGVENLMDFRQLKPILSWQNPFGTYFDTSFNWGPTRGREIYLGYRWKL